VITVEIVEQVITVEVAEPSSIIVEVQAQNTSVEAELGGMSTDAHQQMHTVHAIDTSAGDVEFTLPAAHDRVSCTVINQGSHNVIVVPAEGDEFGNGESNVVLDAPGMAVTFVVSGNYWWIG